MAMKCCCGSELDGSHDHDTCGPPINEEREEEVQAAQVLVTRLLRLCEEWEATARWLWEKVKVQRSNCVMAGLAGEASSLDGCARMLRQALQETIDERRSDEQ